MQPYPHPARLILSILQLIYEEIINVLNNLTVLIKKLAEIEQIRLIPIISITNECLEMLEKSRKTLSSIKTFPRFRNLFSKDKFQKKMRNVYADAIATPNNFVYLTGLTPTTFEEVYRQSQHVATQRLQSTKARVHIRLIDRNLLFSSC
ncbi:unnamed protein product [Didymodactylos carnosus]|uniref:Uncharacterized protein n=1 Tax=Didymodactylos carnosus TaxID=1234261 RepID=A0A8S2X9F7_9BILA|nr:unnamed protein product [Didymodactylos carnosus]